MKRTWTLPLVAATALGALLSISSAALADTVLITGANSGLGLEFVKEYAAKGWTVIATHRRPDVPESLAAVIKDHKNVRVERMDVESLDEIKALATKLKDVPIDVLINNAGVYSDRSVCANDEACRGEGDTQTFTKTDYALFDQIMATNVRGPLAVSEAFIGNVRASKQKKLIAISSTNGSVTFSLGGSGAMAYRASKAALNREFQLIAVHEKPEGVTVLMVHPGAVLTERQANFKSFPGMVEMEPSVQGMIAVIEKATLADTGRFIQYDGTTAPW
ncbi:MAG TPA: SDR family oxidoreductase [Gammaproteobacteria bacterium]|nr:SDR family oxidoreductase [Gammaproteobacteria bacterium]